MSFIFLKERRLVEGQKYGKFEEDIDSSKTYGTITEDYPSSTAPVQESSFIAPEYQVIEFSIHI